MVRWLGTVVLALGIGCGGKPARPPAAPVEVESPPRQPAVPRCGPPAQAAVVEVDSEDEEHLLIVSISDGRELWRGPAGSGSGAPVWSDDGYRLAYQVGADLFLHEDDKPDREIYHGGDDEQELEQVRFRFSPDGGRLATVTPRGVTIVTLGAAGATGQREIEVECAISDFLWSPSGHSLVALCADSSLIDVDLASGRLRKQEVAGLERLLGWRGDPPALLVELEESVAILERERTEPVRSFGESSLTLLRYVPGADRLLLVSESDWSYAQLVRLAEFDQGAARPWLRVGGTDFGFSGDGGWALFVSSSDDQAEEGVGGVYLAATGRSRVTQVLDVPARDYDEEGEGGAPEEPRPEVVGYRYPRPRPQPQPRHCRLSIPRAPVALVEDSRLGFDDFEAEILDGGVVSAIDQNGEMGIYTGTDRIPIDPARMGEVTAGMVLTNDNVALLASRANQSTLWVLGPTGQELWQQPAVDVEQIFRLPDGGVALLRDADTVAFYDADGKLLGEFQQPDGIDAAQPQIDGTILLIDDAGDAVFVDPHARVTRRLRVDELPLGPVALSDGTLVVGFESDDEEEGYQYGIRFVGRDGKERGRFQFEDGDLSLPLRALPGGRLLVALEGESTAMVILDSRGREVGRPLVDGFGNTGELGWFDDGSVAVVDGAYTVELFGADGRFLGGRIVDSDIEMGPIRVGRDLLVVATSDGILFLRRQPR